MKKKNKANLDSYDFGEIYFSTTTDRVDTILEQETLVKEIEFELKCLIENSELDEEFSESNISLKQYILGLTLVFLTIMSLIIIGVTCLGAYKPLVDTFLGTMMNGNYFLLMYSMVGIPLIGAAILQKHIGDKKENRNKNIEQDVIRALTERLEREKEKLEEFKEKYRDEYGFRITYINNEKMNELLTNTFKLYYDCGYNGKKYYKHFKKGVLEKRLGKKYSKEELEEIKKYLVMNEDNYVKKRTK